ncbi:hypothetical protein NQ314_007850 [Rhamnusium bicolor]|uniref:Uncharacterized protein n=1 Tax=Rhamnusium bicolor TaxID=1586634 RepID=A0AAV8YGH6_9CUCU|nr:hypothetical protein NQ314_007850 [Rhamnusium bicolor]
MQQFARRLRKKRAKYKSESELVKGEKHAICEIIHNFHVTEKEGTNCETYPKKNEGESSFRNVLRRLGFRY